MRSALLPDKIPDGIQKPSFVRGIQRKHADKITVGLYGKAAKPVIRQEAFAVVVAVMQVNKFAVGQIAFVDLKNVVEQRTVYLSKFEIAFYTLGFIYMT